MTGELLPDDGALKGLIRELVDPEDWFACRDWFEKEFSWATYESEEI